MENRLVLAGLRRCQIAGGPAAFAGSPRAALLDGTMDVAITQDHRIMMLNCVRILNLREGRAAMAGIEPIQISLFARENLPW